MDIILQLMLAVAGNVIAGVILYFVIKWLDGKW